MPVAITGMHRSGTSMVAHALSLCGLDLGPTDQLLAADDWNADGYWENRKFVELDDWALEQLGGSWDMPPAARPDAKLRKSFVAEARRAVSEIGLAEPWAWKDPRICLLAELWQEAVAELRFVVVVRNPVDVSLSLLRRGSTSARLGLALWSTYYTELLTHVAPADRVVVTYDGVLADPARAIDRLADWLGLSANSTQREASTSAVDSSLRHHASPGALAGLPSHVVDLYEALLLEARDGAPAKAARATSAPKPALPAAGGYGAEVLIAAYSERDALLGEVDGLTADRDNWRERATELETERERSVTERLDLGLDREKALLRLEAGEARMEAERAKAEARIRELDLRLEIVAGEASRATEAANARAAEADALRSDINRLTREHARLTGEIDALAHDRDRWSAKAEEVAGERDRLTAHADALAGDRDGWMAKADALAAEIERLARDRDTWEEEAGRLATDRDAWQTEARHWRAETERLVEAEQQRFRWRARRTAFRWARRIWWAMPAFIRNLLRPVIFRRSGPSSVTQSEQVQSGDTPAIRPAAPARPRVTISRQPIDVPVSVVIPTFNAGADAALFLAALERQAGVPELELVIADSGSRDGTRELFGARADVTLDIAAGEFGHGRTRNQAVAASSGEVVVMMVQDALLLGPHALHDLVAELLADDKLAAVSARQVPRSDADLYGAFNVVSHYTALWREGRRAKPGDPLYRRAAAGVDDVCAALRRPAWEEIQYRDVDFGEDLDFGMRALDAGWRIALSDAVAVAHSHTRDAPYQFRRSVADRLNIAPLVGDDDVCRSAAAAEMTEIVAAGRALLGDVAATLALGSESGDRLSAQLRRVAERVVSPVTTKEPSGGQLAALAECFAELADGAEAGAASAPLRDEFAGLLQWPMLLEFAEAQRSPSPDAVADFVAKLAASVIGRSVGDRLRVSESADDRKRLLVGV